MKIAADYLAKPLHHVVTLSIMQEKFRTCWKYTKVIPLHKKNSPIKKENYRPVAILSPFSKVLGKVIYGQIYEYFHKNRLFSSSLHGYRNNRSTLTALLTMYEKWVFASSKGQVTGVVLADLSAAFDLVSPTLLIEKLKVYGLESGVLAWVHSYLTQRQQAVWVYHVFSEFLETNLGVPQGSILGPLLFLIFFNDLPESINVDIDCYADDSTLSSSDKDVHCIEFSLDQGCNQLSNWMSENSFKLNAEKTQFMVVGTSAKLLRIPSVNVSMDRLYLQEAQDKTQKLLGVVIQNDLKWTSQINSLCSRLKIRLAGLEKLRWLTSQNTRKVLVDGMFHSVLTYCLPLFGGCAQSELDSLQVLQNRAARFVLNCPPRFHREDMFDKLGWLTVRQLIAYLSLVLVQRVKESNEPEFLAACFRRVNHNGHILVHNTPLELYRSSFVYRTSILWNKLPRSLHEEKREKSFKKNVKCWIINTCERFK